MNRRRFLRFAATPAAVLVPKIPVPQAPLLYGGAAGGGMSDILEKMLNPPIIYRTAALSGDINIYPGGITWISGDIEPLCSVLRGKAA